MIALLALGIMQAVFVSALIAQLSKRRRAEHALRTSEAALRSSMDESQTLAGRLIAIQDSERRRIARDLHDNLSQKLSLLCVDISRLGKNAAAPGVLVEGVARLSERARDIASDVHLLSHDLHPPTLEILGLSAAIENMCRDLSCRFGVPVAFRQRAMVKRVPADMALVLFRITQEALQNVFKHSGATAAAVRLAQTHQDIRLHIGDNGQGFDPAAKAGAGLGLLSMRERARLAGGRIDFRSAAGRGTGIVVRLPMRPDASEAPMAHNERQTGAPTVAVIKSCATPSMHPSQSIVPLIAARAFRSLAGITGVALIVAVLSSCGGEKQAAPPATPQGADAPLPEAVSPYDALPENLRSTVLNPFTGDLDEMVKRRVIRVAVTFNRTHYFIDKGQQRGLTYESIKLFEDDLNADLKTGNLKVHVAVVPLSRDQLASALLTGKVGNLVAAMLTVTPERRAVAAFSAPTRINVSEVVVTGPGAPRIATLDDLAGQDVFVREQSIYAESLATLNARLKAGGKAPVVISPLPLLLEDDDVLEMVNAGLIPITITDDYLAQFWKKVFTNLTVHADVAVQSGGELAIQVRKNNPRLLAAVNTWIRKHGKGDAFRNTIESRYLDNVKYAKNAASEAERKKFTAVVDLFKKYGAQYDVDYLLMAAQGYQESTLDQNAKSSVGAIGVMQVMPATGKDLNVGDIVEIDANVHAGVKYMRFMMDQYFKNDPMDNFNKALMTFASYNAGPGRVRQLRREAEKQGLDPSVWFGNVERVASARIGRETVTYVSNIYKYYIAYKLVVEHRERLDAAKAQLKKGQ